MGQGGPTSGSSWTELPLRRSRRSQENAIIIVASPFWVNDTPLRPPKFGLWCLIRRSTPRLSIRSTQSSQTRCELRKIAISHSNATALVKIDVCVTDIHPNGEVSTWRHPGTLWSLQQASQRHPPIRYCFTKPCREQQMEKILGIEGQY